jgi:hypothetical protein
MRATCPAHLILLEHFIDLVYICQRLKITNKKFHHIFGRTGLSHAAAPVCAYIHTTAVAIRILNETIRRTTGRTCV